MCNKTTARILAATVMSAAGMTAQVPATDWRHVGNTSIDLSLAGMASGPVNRAWYSADGSRLLIQTASGNVFETSDFETWRAAAVAAPSEPPIRPSALARLPENGARVRTRAQSSTPVYAFGKFAYRSDNSGASWDNLSGYRAFSILGEDLRDMAVSPANENEIVVAGSAGVFRSLDGGKSWSGLNQGLPNLPSLRLLTLPAGDRGVRLALTDGSVVEWVPGQKQAWRPEDPTEIAIEIQQRQTLSRIWGAFVTAIASSGDYVYTGTVDGRLTVSTDKGNTWQPTFPVNEGGPVERFWVDPSDPRIALAVLGARPRDPTSTVQPVHVIRTQNGGAFWDDLTGNLPGEAAHGITADRATGAVYAATNRGVFVAYTDLASVGTARQWTSLAGLPEAPAMDVKLDPQGNQLWAAVEGYGVYSTLAPHRLRDPRVVSAADLVARATAPGALISVLGARVQTARAGDLAVPVLAATDTESQLQIPFDVRGSSVSLAVDGLNGSRVLPSVRLESAAPAIFVDRDGSAMLLDAESGVMLDAMTPARSRARVQILATGLGRVKPDWPTGLAAPIENPPQVTGTVRAYLDRQPVDVTRAVLSPYIGFYLVEIEIPKIVNYGPATTTAPSNAGTYIMEARYDGSTNYDAISRSATLTILKAAPYVTWGTPGSITYGTALGAAELNAAVNVAGGFSYSPAAGTVLDAGAHTLTASFTPADVVNYEAASISVSLTVSKANSLVTWYRPLNMVYGTALGAAQLNATANVPGTFTYSPAAGTVLTAGEQVLSVAFTPADPGNYNGTSALVPLTVTKAASTITWPTPADIVYGAALGATQLNATANVPGTFTYSPAAGTVVTAGSESLSVTFAPTDAANYNGATATVLLSVTKAASTITWPTPADIVSGTALGATQLNATANVPGTFTYSPAAGVLLNAGAQSLSVTFAPTDAANYNGATATVPLTVTKAASTITWPTPADIVPTERRGRRS